MSSKRYFDNPFDDYIEANTVLDVTSGQLKNPIRQTLLDSFKSLLKVLEQNLKNIDARDHTVYTGSAGYALLYWHLSQVFNDDNLLDKSLSILDPILKRLRLKSCDISFILGDTGILSLGSVVHHLKGNQNGSDNALKSLKAMVAPSTNIKSDIPDELLYGRSGLLYSLLFVRKYISNSNQIIEDNDVRLVVDAILKSGQNCSKRHEMSQKCPLMYYWYRTPYVGAAHGLIGIMALLLEAKNHLTSEELNQFVKPTIDFILSIQLPSGNFPSDLDDFQTC